MTEPTTATARLAVERRPLNVAPGPAEVAVAWIHPGTPVSVHGQPVQVPEPEFGAYLTVAGSALPAAGELSWHRTSLRLAPPLADGGAVREIAARRLARAARESLGSLVLYVEHEGQRQGGEPLRWVAARIRAGAAR